MLGQKIIHLDEIGSTNAYGTEFITQNPSNFSGTVISTGLQTKGKGQAGNTWHSEKDKNLLVSALLNTGFVPVEKHFFLNITISLAIVDLLHELNIKAQVKWPNDILVNQKKIAGILIENTIVGQYFGASIIGVGLNLNQSGFPSSIPNATSAKIELNREWEIKDILVLLIEKLNKRILSLSLLNFDGLMEEYIGLLYGKGINRQFRDNKLNTTFTGEIEGVTEEGLLEIMDVKGNKHQFAFKEVDFML